MKEFFSKNPKAAIAFSGGVDSAFLLYMAKKYAKEIKAYYIKSAFQPSFELKDAKRLAKSLGVDLKVLDIDVFEHSNIIANDEKRCYHCKKMIFKALKDTAAKDGFSLILDGTNASDKYEERPGMKALEELSVRSPLRECGLTKEEIRRLSKEVGLFTWNKPAYACLATRVKTGQKIENSILEKIEKSEDILFKLGFTDFRLRVLGEDAKIEISSWDMPLFLGSHKVILNSLLPFFKEVYLDMNLRDERQ